MARKPTTAQITVAERIRIGRDAATIAETTGAILPHPVCSFDSYVVGDVMRVHRALAEPGFQLGRYEMFTIARDGTVGRA